ncbi:MAG: DUF4340 domain-containing protein [Eubacteriales bacterium]
MNKAQKKRIITLVILICAAAALAVIYFAVTGKSDGAQNDAETTQTTDTTVYVAQDDASTITAISYTWQGQTVDLVYSSDMGKWTWADDRAFPLKYDYPASMATAISTILCDRFVEDSAEHFEEFGLNEPYLSITAVYGDVSHTYNIGAYNSFSKNYYFNIGGTNKVYMVAAGLLPYFEYTLLDMAAVDDPPVLSDTALYEIKSVSADGSTLDADAATAAAAAVGKISIRGITAAAYDIAVEGAHTFDIAYTESTTVTNEDGSLSSTVHVDKALSLSVWQDGETYFVKLPSGLVYTADAEACAALIAIAG